MSVYPVRRPIARRPTHPGVLMRESLTHMKQSIVGAASRMGISRQALHAALSGRTSVTADLALRFAAIGGGEPELLLRMQDAVDLWDARRALGPTLARITARAA